MSKAKSTINRAKRELYKLAQNTNDPYEQRVAYAMATILQWAIEETVGWPSPCVEAKKEAAFLRNVIERRDRDGVKP